MSNLDIMLLMILCIQSIWVINLTKNIYIQKQINKALIESKEAVEREYMAATLRADALKNRSKENE